jgi:hypothetical protein
VWSRTPSAARSTILKVFPSVLRDFRGRKWTLLYRGSRDGFRASNFHGKCDGQSSTVTIILTATGCIFGGFTPIGWHSRGSYEDDATKQSFLFRIKDSRNSDARVFPLLTSSNAIYGSSSCGPIFGRGRDIHVSDSCHENKSSYTRLGGSYVNDTSIAGNEVFTAEYNFTVKEIEVFSIRS